MVMLRQTTNRLKPFLRATSGSIAINLAVAAPMVMGGVGVAVDFGVMHAKRTELQAVADLAVIAAAKEFTVANMDEKSLGESAETHARANTGIEVENLAVKTEVGPKRDRIRVTLTETWAPFFAHFIGSDVTPIVVNATALVAGQSNICVLALHPSAPAALEVNKASTVLANDCGLYANSKSASAVTLDAGAKIVSSMVCSAGGVSSLGVMLPDATTDCPPLPDPLAGRAPPKFGGCDYNSVSYKSGKHVLTPGVYCGGLVVSSSASIEFKPGVYVMKDGPFQVGGQSDVTGKDVGFYFTGKGAVVKFTQQTTISLSGRESGEMAGLLFMEDRNTPVGSMHRINSQNAHTLTGTIYMPSAYLVVDPCAPVGQNSAYTAIIVQQLRVSMGPVLTLNSDYDKSPVPVPEGIRTSDQIVLAD
jgi:Flp pilus assembly protein TadG